MTETGERNDLGLVLEESSVIGLVLDEFDRLLLHRDDVGGPHGLFVPGPWTAGRQQGADVCNELGLHEQVLKRWMSGVRGLRCKGELPVRRQLDLACGAKPRLVSDTRRISASSSADTTTVKPDTIDPSRRVNSAWSS